MSVTVVWCRFFSQISPLYTFSGIKIGHKVLIDVPRILLLEHFQLALQYSPGSSTRAKN
jgi:hypothetical protein